jgi:hypothetical protein
MTGSASSRPFANVGYLFATPAHCPVCDVLLPIYIGAAALQALDLIR